MKPFTNFIMDQSAVLREAPAEGNNLLTKTSTFGNFDNGSTDNPLTPFSTILSGLQVLVSPLAEVRASLQEKLCSYLEGEYSQLPVYEHYGAKSITQLIGLSVRYALWTFPTSMLSDINALKSNILWLSVIWLIDGVFDSYPDLCTELDRDYVINIVKGDNSNMIVNTNPSLLFSSALDCFQDIYKIFMSLIKEYALKRPLSYEKYKNATIEYLETLTHHTNPTNLTEYEAWRLKGGGIPCVFWQLSLYSGLEVESSSLVRSISLIISYQNDILSINRDIAKETPNLVLMLKRVGGEDIDAYYEAIKMVNGLYDEVRRDIKNVSSSTKTLCESVLVGSHFWANSEPRYAVGVKILEEFLESEKIMTNSRFKELVKNKEHAPADPKA